jgi:hypothetical protein
MLQWADHAIANKESRHQVFAALPRTPTLAPAPAPPPHPPVAHPPPGWHPSPNYPGKNPIYRPPRPPLTTPTPAPTAPLMHEKFMHELCSLSLHIPTYLHVMRCYNHVLH